MKTMLRAAIMVLSIGSSATHADDADGYSATTLFTSIPSEQPSWVAAASGRAAITVPNGAVGAPLRDHQPPRHLAVPAGPGRRRALTTPRQQGQALRLHEPKLGTCRPEDGVDAGTRHNTAEA